MKYFKIIGLLFSLFAIAIGCQRDEKEFIKPVPVSLEADAITSSGFTARWNTFLGAHDYSVEVSNTDAFDSLLDGFPILVSDTILKVESLESSSSYYYRVMASKYNGPTDYSRIIKVITGGLAVPVVLDATDVAATSFKAHWRKVTEASSYLLYVAEDVNFTNILSQYNGISIEDTVALVNNLNVNQNYFYRIKSIRGESISAPSATVHAPTSELGVPSSLTTSSTGQTYFTMSWSEVANTTAYLVFVSEDPLMAGSLPAYNGIETSSLSIKIEGLDANKEYYFRVQAKRDAVFSGKSDIGAVSTLPLAQPSSLPAAQIQISSFEARWNNIANAESYLIDISKDQNFSGFLTGYNGKELTDTTLVVTNLEKNTDYFYRIKYSGLGAVSEYSVVQKVTTKPFESPVALSASNILSKSFRAQWEPVVGVDQYLLDISENANFSSFISGYESFALTDTVKDVSGLTLGKTYYYRVRGAKSGNISGNSNIISVTTTDLVSPTIEAISSTTTSSFYIRWSIVEGASGYQLDLSESPVFTTMVAGYENLGVDQNEITVTGLEAGKKYYFRVRATDGKVVTDNSDLGEVSTVALTAPVASSATSVGVSSFTAVWNVESEATSYLLDVSTNSSFEGYLTGYNSKEVVATSVNITGLTPEVTYYYRVRSKKGTSVSVNSGIVSATTLAVNAPSVNIPVSTDRQAFGFDISWTNVSDAESYLIYVSKDASFNSMVSGYNGKEVFTTSESVNVSDPYATYYVRVKSKLGNYSSVVSNVITVDPAISNSCQLAYREYTGFWREEYTYNAEGLLATVTLNNLQQGWEERKTSMTYTLDNKLDVVEFRYRTGGSLNLIYRYTCYYEGEDLTKIDVSNAGGTFLERWRFVYLDGRVVGHTTYSDEAETQQTKYRSYHYNSQGLLTEVRDASSAIRRLSYNTEFNAEYMINTHLQLALFDLTNSTNNPYRALYDLSQYQYYNGSTWEVYDYTYQYNQYGMPVKVTTTGGSIPELTYGYQNCGF